ncbi:helix-turn-helix domain-containing protein [Brevibacterium limosum]|uniref:helix-turn-helix domain-containing protein n=1 Tax=Brevibacterium limosum TaxID=2697565 RepID=UPI001422B4F5|nr:helix-turn-helix domain-containing protein [Brevibacterium limosum]
MTASDEKTTFPAKHSEYARMREMLRSNSSLTLGAGGADFVAVPDEVAEILDSVLSVLENGDAVAVSHRSQSLTTQQAAETLAISRPTLIKYLEQGEIPYEMRGRHRRVLLRDVLDFQSRNRIRRRERLDAMEDDVDDYRPVRDAGFSETR